MKLLAALLFVAGTAVAGDELYMPNDSDGFLTLTNDECPLGETISLTYPHKAINDDDEGNAMWGCWVVEPAPQGALEVVQVVMIELGRLNRATFGINLFSTEKKRWDE